MKAPVSVGGDITRRELVGGALGAPASMLAPSLAGVARVRLHVTENLTLDEDMLLGPGETIHIAPSARLTLRGDFQAPARQVFAGGGTVDLTQSAVLQARPEWWGARPNDPEIDCVAAIEAALAAHPAVMLGIGDYYLSRPLNVYRAGARLWGTGSAAPSSGRPRTRLVLNSPVGPVVRAGPVNQPASVNDFCRGIDMRWLVLARRQAPRGDATGLLGQFLLLCHFEGIDAEEHVEGFRFRGAVRTVVRDCRAFRSARAAAGEGWTGFRLDGSRKIGLAGGNASVTLELCNATVGGDPQLASAVGLLLQGAFSDSFITDFETSGVAVGIRASGPVPKGLERSGQANLHLTRPVIDQCSLGIDFAELGKSAVVDLHDPYIAVAPQALAAIRLNNCVGAISISGGQLIGWVDADAGGNALGLYCIDSEGVDISGLKIMDHRRPAGFDRCSFSRFSGSVHNPGAKASQAALWVRECHDLTLECLIRGSEAVFPQGLLLLGQSTRNIRVAHAGIDPNSIEGRFVNFIAFTEGASQASLSTR